MIESCRYEGWVHADHSVWVAYYSDHSSAVPCVSEVDALRIAIDRGMEVVRVPFGSCVWDTVVATAEAGG